MAKDWMACAWVVESHQHSVLSMVKKMDAELTRLRAMERELRELRDSLDASGTADADELGAVLATM